MIKLMKYMSLPLTGKSMEEDTYIWNSCQVSQPSWSILKTSHTTSQTHKIMITINWLVKDSKHNPWVVTRVYQWARLITLKTFSITGMFYS